jgi:aerobic carbon-monoxide dehydrogenase large subunit
MLHAAILRSPHAHARLRAIDGTAARTMAGVVAVLTGADIAGVLGEVPTRAMVGGWAVDDMQAVEQPVLARDKVYYVGQPVAIVVAQNRYLAKDAAALIRVEYEPLPPVLDPLAALQAEATPIHATLGSNVGLRVAHEGGDLATAFTQADRVIQQRYHVQRLAPTPLETRGVAASYQPQDDFLTVWNSTQAPHHVKHYVAQLLDRLESRVRVLAADVGGGFGEKGCLFPEDIAIPYLSTMLECPVKWVAERHENMLTFHARGHTVDVEAAVQHDGTILGMRVRIVADLGAYFLLEFISICGQKLTWEQHVANQGLHQRRLWIDYIKWGVKRCRIVKDRIRWWKEGIRDLVMELCCVLHNFRVRLTPWQPLI